MTLALLVSAPPPPLSLPPFPSPPPLFPARPGFNPNPDNAHQPLVTSLRPLTSATLTIRIIKSFEFRTQKALVMQGVDLESVTVGGLMERCREGGSSRLAGASSLSSCFAREVWGVVDPIGY